MGQKMDLICCNVLAGHLSGDSHQLRNMRIKSTMYQGWVKAKEDSPASGPGTDQSTPSQGPLRMTEPSSEKNKTKEGTETTVGILLLNCLRSCIYGITPDLQTG